MQWRGPRFQGLSFKYFFPCHLCFLNIITSCNKLHLKRSVCSYIRGQIWTPDLGGLTLKERLPLSTHMCSFCVWPAPVGLSLSEGDAVNTWVASWGWEEGAGGSWEVLGASSCSLVLSFNESQCCHQRQLLFYFFLRTWKTTQQQETYYSVITVAVSVLLTRYIYTQNHFKMMPSNYQIFIFSVFCPI